MPHFLLQWWAMGIVVINCIRCINYFFRDCRSSFPCMIHVLSGDCLSSHFLAWEYKACLYSGDCYQKNNWTIPGLLVLGWLLSEEQVDNSKLVCTRVTAIRRTTGQYQACLYSGDCYQKNNWTIPGLFVLGWLLSEEQLDNTRLVCTRVTAIKRTTWQFQACL